MSNTFLSQWVGENPAAQGPAKQHEFMIYVPPLLHVLAWTGARDVVDYQAGEGVVSTAFCAQSPENHSTFLLPSRADDPDGTFRRMVEDITAPKRNQIKLAATPEEIKTASADAILFNNILGCQGTLWAIEAAVGQAERIVKKGGYAIVTVPNALGGKFSSYTCSDLPPADVHGAKYNFQIRGEDAVFENIFLTEKCLTAAFQRHGFGPALRTSIADRPYQGVCSKKPAFFQYAMQRLG